MTCKTLAGRFALTAIAAAIVSAPQAAEVVWLGDNNDWNDGVSWFGNQPPADGDAVRVTDQIDSVVTTLNIGTLADGPSFASIVVDGANNNVTLVHSLDFTLRTGSLTVGETGSASFVQSAGVVSTPVLTLGAANTASGSYLMSGAAASLGTELDPVQRIVVGEDGSGSFRIEAGTIYATDLHVGGWYDGNTNTGHYGTGTMTQTGGVVNTGALYLGTGPNAVYNLEGGTLAAASAASAAPAPAPCSITAAAPTATPGSSSSATPAARPRSSTT